MKKIVSGFLIFLFLFTLALFGAYSWYNNAIYSENISNEDIAFSVREGDNLLSIATRLVEKGVIQSEQALRIYVRLNNIEANIKPGEYSIAKGTNVPNLINLLEEGTYKASVLITIPEGMRYEKIATLLSTKFATASESSKFQEVEFLDIAANPDKFTFSDEVESILTKYKPAGKPLRGILFPDTYRFDSDANALTVIETLLINFDKRLIENSITPETLGISQSNLKSIYEVISLASIIEKEAGKDADRPLVSGIFHNRLSSNFPLQSDITIHFIKNDDDTFISFQDTKIDSPYNTYLNVGVTPTPINNPGISSIKAAMQPLDTDYFYFIYDENGTLYYAKTYEEHLVNVNKYL